MQHSKNTPNLWDKSKLIHWVCDILPLRAADCKIEDFGDGVVYCLLLHHYHPTAIAKEAIKLRPISQYDCYLNIRLFQKGVASASLKLNIDVKALRKGAYQPNWLLLKQLHYALNQTVTHNDSFSTDRPNDTSHHIHVQEDPKYTELAALEGDTTTLKKNHSILQKDTSALEDRIKQILLHPWDDTVKVNQIKILLGLPIIKDEDEGGAYIYNN